MDHTWWEAEAEETHFDFKDFGIMSTPDETKPWFMTIRGVLLQ